MNQEKIGKFITECRKKKNLTQDQLAEKLGISDRAVSKWERGLNMPDASLMLELTSILGITVNELLSGEIIREKEYMNKAEENLVELKEINDEYAKKLLYFEWIIGFTCSISFMILIFTASFLEMPDVVRILLIVIGSIIFAVGITNCIKIEQIAGYYECNKCHHKYIPSYNSVLFSMHINRTRYMKCPKCHEKSWNKKVISK